MDDICYAVKDENGFYWCGYNKWDKQIRKAKLFHSWKYAVATRDCPRGTSGGAKIVKVRISEMEEYNPDWEM